LFGLDFDFCESMSSFVDERKFAAWAGVSSGKNESAGKKKDQNADMAIRIYESC
jgi:hypothetical protein